MDDASGRYTNGFFWGNSFFVGSATECEFIGQTAVSSKSSSSPESISEAEEFNAEPHKKRANVGHSGPTSIVLPQGGNDRPPYPLGFFMMKIAVNGSLSPVVIETFVIYLHS